MTAHMSVSLEVNGEQVDALVLPRTNLADFLREQLQLTGTHVGCEHGVCGACTLRVNGDIVRSCLMLAVQANNASVETIEGLSDSGEIADLQAAFRDRNALQCGFCTPGMLMAAQDLLRQNPVPDRRSRSANICPAITAAAPAIRPSSMRSKPPRNDAPAIPTRSKRHDRCARKAERPLGAGPPELVYWQDGAAAKPRSPDAGAGTLCQRRRAAADGACGVSALAACARQNRWHRRCGRQARQGRHCRRDRAGTGRNHHALGRRALASERAQIGAAARDRDRSCLLAGRGGGGDRGDQPCDRRGRRRTGCRCIRRAGSGDGDAHRARSGNPCHSCLARRQSRLRAPSRCRQCRPGIRRCRRGGGSRLRVRASYRRDAGTAIGGRGLEPRRGAADDLPGHASAAHGAEYRSTTSRPVRRSGARALQGRRRLLRHQGPHLCRRDGDLCTVEEAAAADKVCRRTEVESFNTDIHARDHRCKGHLSRSKAATAPSWRSRCDDLTGIRTLFDVSAPPGAIENPIQDRQSGRRWQTLYHKKLPRPHPRRVPE